VISAVTDDGITRGEIEDALVGDTAWVGEFIDKALLNDAARQTVAEDLLGDSNGREAVVLHGMPAGSTEPSTTNPLDQFAIYVRDVDTSSWLEEFLDIVQETTAGGTAIAENLVGKVDGRVAIMEALTATGDLSAGNVVPSPELMAFANLLTQEATGQLVFANRLPSFAKALVTTDVGQSVTVDYLFEADGGATEVGKELYDRAEASSSDTTALDAVLTEVVTSANTLSMVTDKLLGASGGAQEIVTDLASELPPAPGPHYTAFKTALDADTALKGALCA
jgi:hypothetical protein